VPVKEYENYITLNYNDGSRMKFKIDRIGERLLKSLVVTFFHTKSRDLENGTRNFEDQIVFSRVFFQKRLSQTVSKKGSRRVKKDLDQEEILIVAKEAECIRIPATDLPKRRLVLAEVRVVGSELR